MSCPLCSDPNCCGGRLDELLSAAHTRIAELEADAKLHDESLVIMYMKAVYSRDDEHRAIIAECAALTKELEEMRRNQRTTPPDPKGRG